MAANAAFAQRPTFVLSLPDLCQQVSICQVHNEQHKPWFHRLVPSVSKQLNQHAHCLRLKGFGPGCQIGVILARVALPRAINYLISLINAFMCGSPCQ